mmetsp:Transcript_98980/g.317399  ORF Transcript_98980/g.317399 Transcript_98980/m.317399 type:complete len:332 (-) Transcript_98980:1769-2764(-)
MHRAHRRRVALRRQTARARAPVLRPEPRRPRRPPWRWRPPAPRAAAPAPPLWPRPLAAAAPSLATPARLRLGLRTRLPARDWTAQRPPRAADVQTTARSTHPSRPRLPPRASSWQLLSPKLLRNVPPSVQFRAASRPPTSSSRRSAGTCSCTSGSPLASRGQTRRAHPTSARPSAPARPGARRLASARRQQRVPHPVSEDSWRPPRAPPPRRAPIGACPGASLPPKGPPPQQWRHRPTRRASARAWEQTCQKETWGSNWRAKKTPRARRHLRALRLRAAVPSRRCAFACPSSAPQTPPTASPSPAPCCVRGPMAPPKDTLLPLLRSPRTVQ